jgi:hypothetical protein
MARPGSKNPDYDEDMYPDEHSTFMHVFHDRRDEGRRTEPTSFQEDDHGR